jgi:hypothetical protein
MSTEHSADDSSDFEGTADPTVRAQSFGCADGTIQIYDPENHDAWIQAGKNTAVETEDMI